MSDAKPNRKPTAPGRDKPREKVASSRRWDLGPFFFPMFTPLVIGLLCAAGAWLFLSTQGMLAAIAIANHVAPVHIEATGAHGALAREFGFERLHIQAGGADVDLHRLRTQLQGFSVRPLRLEFDALAADQVDVKLAPTPPSEDVPESIVLPLAVSVKRLAVGEFKLDGESSKLKLRAIDAQVDLDETGYRVRDGRLQFGEQEISLAGRLDGAKPFGLELQGEAQARWREHPVKAQWQATGSLVNLTLKAEVSGGDARGHAEARIGSFEKQALKSLHADLNGVDLRAWLRDLPMTRLRIRADLRPDAQMQRLSGPVQIDNVAAGPLDTGKLPLQTARGTIDASAEGIHVSGLNLQLPRGSASGSFAAQFGKTLGWQAQATLAGIDPATLYSGAKPLLIDGKLQGRQAAGVTEISGQLRNRGAPAVDARIDLRMTSMQLNVVRAELKLGSGSAVINGSVGLQSPQRVALKGQLDRVDPSLILKGVDASLSGDIDVDAQISPKPVGTIHFALKDSRAFGRPLSARGTVQMNADEQFDVDVDLAVRTTTLTARGSLGAPGKELTVAVAAPHLNEWLPQLQGAAQLQAKLNGAWRAPAIDATVQAKDLRYGEHRISAAQASGSYAGGNDGQIKLRATLDQHSFRANPAASLRTLLLTVDGPPSAHRIALTGTTESAQSLGAHAQGTWSAATWRGVLQDAEIGAPLNIKLRAAVPLFVAAEQLDFGPAELSVGNAALTAVQLHKIGNTLRSSGAFTGFKPADWVRRDRDRTSLIGTPQVQTLELRGTWDVDLRAGAQADGHVLIERSSGDLFAGTKADKALGIHTARLEARLVANHLQASATILSERGGNLDAKAEAWVQPDGGAQAAAASWRLAQQRPWNLDAATNLASIEWLNVFLSDSARANFRFDGRLAGKVKVSGTPAQPVATGNLDGDGLRVAAIDQGLRLENGQLRAHLSEDLIVLDQLRFASPLQIRPKNSRAAAKVDFNRVGSVNATGQLRLKDFTGVVQVAAEDLAVLQLPERWLLATGGANISFSTGRVQLNGALAAKAGLIDISHRGLPTLSSDVVVKRADEPAPRTPAIAVGFDVSVDLGDSLYITGDGLNTRASGALRLRSGPRGAINATGSIESQDGTYEGFGQRLAIKRGRLNFQGPLNNPGLDILAVRRGLSVDVGVTITRTAAEPLVRLYSDPPMPDNEALSWLVLGRPLDQSNSDNLALAQAAAGLLSGTGDSMTSRVAKSLGVDELALTSGSGAEAGTLLPRRSVAGSLSGNAAPTTSTSTEVIRIGKNLGDLVTLSYEQGLAGAASVVQLTYRLSQRLSLAARAGTVNALDLVYTLAFD